MTTTIGSLDLGALSDLREDVTQYFWFESNSSSAWGSGAHVTLYPESQFTDPNNANYIKGQNILMNTDGLSIRNGALPMMVLDNDSLDFNVIDTTNNTYINVASFGASTKIGKDDGARTYIDEDSITLLTPEDVPAFSVDIGQDSEVQTVEKMFKFTQELTFGSSYSNSYASLNSVANGDTFTIYFVMMPTTTSGGGGNIYKQVTFTKGTSDTKVVQDTFAGYTTETTVIYTAPNTLTFTFSSCTPASAKGRLSLNKIVYETTVRDTLIEMRGNIAIDSKSVIWTNPTDVFVIETYEHDYSKVSSGNNMSWDQAKTKAGYYPIGVVGFRTGRASLVTTGVRITNRAVGSCTLCMNARAVATASAATAYMQVLWVKAE